MMNFRTCGFMAFTFAALLAAASAHAADGKSTLQTGMAAAVSSANSTMQQGLTQAYGGGTGAQGLPYGGYPVYNAYLPYGAMAGGANCLPGMPGCAQMPGAVPAQASSKPQYVYKGAQKKGVIDAPLPKRLFNNIPKRR